MDTNKEIDDALVITTLRKAVASLEAELEVKLFSRDAYGISTNLQGKILAARLRLADQVAGFRQAQVAFCQ